MTLARSPSPLERRQVLDCASPLALSHRTHGTRSMYHNLVREFFSSASFSRTKLSALRESFSRQHDRLSEGYGCRGVARR
jgi:hypothetical protein